MSTDAKDLFYTWMGRAFSALVVGTCGLMITMGTAILDKVDTLNLNVTRLNTSLPYIVRDVEDVKQGQREHVAVHAALQAQVEDLRNQNYKHGW